MLVLIYVIHANYLITANRQLTLNTNITYAFQRSITSAQKKLKLMMDLPELKGLKTKRLTRQNKSWSWIIANAELTRQSQRTNLFDETNFTPLHAQ